MRLCKSPASFRRALDLIFAKVKWKTFRIYIEDVIIYSTMFVAHISLVEEIKSYVMKVGLTLKITYCSFFQRKVEYLGHNINTGELQIEPKTS